MTDLTPIPQHLLKRSPDNDEFRPKLSDHERCSVLALHLMGVKTEALAMAYGLNRRTVTHICNSSSTHYKETRKERKRMGDEAFIEKYADEAARQRLLSVSNKPNLKSRKADARERRKAGIHVVKPEQCAHSHRLEIAYREDGDPPGWYYRDLDSEDQGWYHNGVDSLASSQNCLALAQANLTDD